MNISLDAHNIKDELKSWRRELHMIPELGINLPNTVKFITKILKELDVDYIVYEDISCVVATIGKGSPCFMLRSDMDALPIKEETNLEFASKNGNMHACGHDMHTTILLGAAKILKKYESQLKGTVKLLFQSGEESFEGARLAVEKGVLENPKVEAAFAMHVSSLLKNGVILYGENPMSSVYGFEINIKGLGGHGSNPDRCIDPINAGVQIYLALQSIVARECAANKEVVLTIGKFQSGTASNIIPENAVLQGTLRTFDSELANYIIKRIQDVTKNIGETYRCKTNVVTLSNVNNVVCDKILNEEFKSYIEELELPVSILNKFHNMGSEDFSFISHKVPSAYFALGATDLEDIDRVGQHNPKTVFSEDCLEIGAAAYAKVAFSWLSQHGNI